jgi:DNA gyrase subunit A
MKLGKLTNLERQGIKDEHAMLINLIADLADILAKPERILTIIKNELAEMKERYGDARRTDIVESVDDMDIEDLIPEENVVVTITNTGYVKRMPLDTYRQQHRGGVGLIGMETKEEDFVTKMFVTSTHDYIMFFTSKGRVFWLKAYRIPSAMTRHTKGNAIINLLPRLEDGERITTAMPVRTFDDGKWLVFSTKKGVIKKTALSAYSNPRVTGIWAIKLRDGDELVRVAQTDGQNQILLASKRGQAVRFNETDVRAVSRHSIGVKGMTLAKGDEVISMEIVSESDILLAVTENGYGKRTPVDTYRKTRRAAKGVKAMKIVEKKGGLVTVTAVQEDHELIITSEYGMVIRLSAADIPLKKGRVTQGNIVMRLNRKDDRVVTVSKVLRSQEEEEVLEKAAATEVPEKKKMSDADYAGLKEDANGDSNL